MPLMKSLRTFRLATTSGHVVQFVANEPKEVPAAVLSEAMKHGCVPVDGTVDQALFEEAGGKARVDFTGDVRRSVLFLAVKAVAEKNDPKEFDGGGNPLASVVKGMVGFEITPAEVVDIYHIYGQSKRDEVPFELHPSAMNIVRVIEAGDKNELLELAEEFGMKREVYKGLAAKDIRKALLVKFSGIAD